MSKRCAILLNMGGPNDPDDVRKYLYNIFSDRMLIRLPGGWLFQKMFARLISSLRAKKVREHYRLIGGGSPLLKWTTKQAELIENNLKDKMPGFRCFVGMRYFRPTIRDTISEAYNSGFRRFIFLPLYPQYSRATTGSSFAEAEKVLSNYSDVEAEYINDFHDDAEYIALLKQYINDNIKENEKLLFSAHSLPKSFIYEGDPYVTQVKKTVTLVADGREYYLSFQSRSGPVDWVGPNTIEEAKWLLSDKARTLFVVAVSFVSDHIETLYEIDIDLRERVGVENRDRINRMPMFNDDPRFAVMLSKLIQKRCRADE